MKLLAVMIAFLMVFSFGVFAEEEEKPKVDTGKSDPIGDILFAPFAVIGAIFSGGYDYDPDSPAYYGWYDRYEDPRFGYYGYYDPFYYHDFKYDRYQRYPYRWYNRHHRYPYSRYYFYDPC